MDSRNGPRFKILSQTCDFWSLVKNFEPSNFQKFDEDWWIGRIVEKNSRIGFIPTAKRLTRSGDYVTDEFLDEDSQNPGKSSRKGQKNGASPKKIIAKNKTQISSPILKDSPKTPFDMLILEDIQRPQRQKTTIKFDIARGRQYIKSLNRADAKKRAKKIM